MAGEGPKTPRNARELVNKVRTAISRAIDGLDDGKGKIGVARLSELIKASLERDPVGTLKALAPYAPKDVTVESFNGKAAEQLTDDELANIIATRALERAKQASSQESIEDMLH